MASRALAIAVLSFVAGCIPSRDNPHDPAVKPVARIDITVDGQPATSGGRGARWALAAGRSEDPDGSDTLRRYEWFLSTGPLLLENVANGEFESIGTGPAISSTNETIEFGDRLDAVSDFDDGGVAPRWIRLDVEDRDGIESSAFAPIAVVNRAPIVSLGADRRIAPAGRWWMGASVPHEIVIRAAVSDPDGDLDLLFSAEHAGEWTVSGALAAVLDVAAPIGIVDPGFVFDGGRELRFAAPLDPTRGRVTFRIGDSFTNGVEASFGSHSIRADVLTTLWNFDEGSGHLGRVDTSLFHGPLSVNHELSLLVENGSTLIASYPSASSAPTLRFVDRGLAPVVPAASVTLPMSGGVGSIEAARDDSGSLWVLLQNVGIFRYATLAGAPALSLTAIPGEGTAAADFVSSDVRGKLVPAEGAANGVWVIGGELGTTGDRRLFRLASNGVPFLTVNLGSPTDVGDRVLARNPGDLLWGAEGLRVYRIALDGAGSTVPAFSLGGDCNQANSTINSMAFDDARNVLWVSTLNPSKLRQRLCRIDVATIPPPATAFRAQQIDSPGPLVVDPIDGTALMIANAGNGVSRYDATSTDSLEFVPMQEDDRTAARLHLDAGSLVVTVAPTTAGGPVHRVARVEGAEFPVPVVAIPNIDPYVFDRVRVAVDGQTGNAWLFRPDRGDVEAWSPAGDLLRTVHIADNPVPGREMSGVIAIDPDARRAWVAWALRFDATDTVARGRIVSFAIPDDYPAPGIDLDLTQLTPISLDATPGIDLLTINDLSVVPSGHPVVPGRLCVAGTRDGESFAEGPVVAIDGAGTGNAIEFPFSTDTSLFLGAEATAAASPQSGECWFVRELPDDGAAGGQRGLVVGTDGLFAGTVDNYGVSRRIRRAQFTPYDARAFSANTQPSGTTSWVSALNGISATAQVVTATTPLIDGAGVSSLAIDPYYGHLFVSHGDPAPGGTAPQGNGEIVRVSRGFVEMDRTVDSTSRFPRLRLSP